MENWNKLIIVFFHLHFLSCGISDGPKEENHFAKDSDTRSITQRWTQFDGRLLRTDTSLQFKVVTGYAVHDHIPNYYQSDSSGVTFTSAITPNDDTVRLLSVIDTTSFRMVGSLPLDKLKIRNPAYFNGRMNNYYMDTNHFYSFIGHPPFSFKMLGRAIDAELLGGGFVRIGGYVYAQGSVLSGVDVEQFHTLDIAQLHKKTEWSLTIGLDNTHIYVSNSPITEERYSDLVGWIGPDSLRSIYFK